MFANMSFYYRQKSSDKEQKSLEKEKKQKHNQRQEKFNLLVDKINNKISEYFTICDQNKEFNNLTKKLDKIKNQNNIEIIIMKSSSGNNKPPFSLDLFVKRNENSDFQISFQDYTYNKPEMTDFVKEGMEIIGFIPDFYDSFIARSFKNSNQSLSSDIDAFKKPIDYLGEFIGNWEVWKKFYESEFPKISQKLQADIDDIDSYNEKLYIRYFEKFNEMSNSIQECVNKSKFKKVDDRNFEFETHKKDTTLYLDQ